MLVIGVKRVGYEVVNSGDAVFTQPEESADRQLFLHHTMFRARSRQTPRVHSNTMMRRLEAQFTRIDRRRHDGLMSTKISYSVG